MSLTISELIFASSVTAVISFVVGVIIGEPIKLFINKAIRKSDNASASKSLIKELSKTIGKLLSEMKEDLAKNQTRREFILLSKSWSYNGSGNPILVYYFEDHKDLKDKIRILENHNLIENITYNNIDRYKFTEKFVKMLQKYSS